MILGIISVVWNRTLRKTINHPSDEEDLFIVKVKILKLLELLNVIFKGMKINDPQTLKSLGYDPVEFH